MAMMLVWLVCLAMTVHARVEVNVVGAVVLAVIVSRKAVTWSNLQLALVVVMALLPIWQVFQGSGARRAMPELPIATSLRLYAEEQTQLPAAVTSDMLLILNDHARIEHPLTATLFDPLELPPYVSVSLLTLDMLPISWRGQYFRGDYSSLQPSVPHFSMRDGRLFQVTLEAVPNARETQGFLLTEVLLLSEHEAERGDSWLVHCNRIFQAYRPVVVEQNLSQILERWAQDLKVAPPPYDLHLIAEPEHSHLMDLLYLLWALAMAGTLFFLWRHLEFRPQLCAGSLALVVLAIPGSASRDALSCFASYIFGARWCFGLFSSPFTFFFTVLLVFLTLQTLIRALADRRLTALANFGLVVSLAVWLPTTLQRAGVRSFVHPLEAMDSPGAFLAFLAFLCTFAGLVLLIDATRPPSLRVRIGAVGAGALLVACCHGESWFAYGSLALLFLLQDKLATVLYRAALAALCFYPTLVLQEQAVEVTFVKQQLLDEITLLGERNYFRMSRIIQRLPELERELDRGGHAHLMELFAKGCGLLENEVDFSLTLVGPDNKVVSEINYHLASDRLRILSTPPNRIDTFRSETDNALWMAFRRTLVTNHGDYDFTAMLGSDYQNLSVVRGPRNLAHPGLGQRGSEVPYFNYIFEVFDDQGRQTYSQGTNTAEPLAAEDLERLKDLPVYWRIEGRNTVFFFKDKETIYRITHKATSLSLVVSRFILLWLSVSLLVWLVRLAQRPGRSPLDRWQRSFSLKLAAFMFLASGLPMATLGFILIDSIQQNQAREELAFAQSRMLAAQNLVRGLSEGDDEGLRDFRTLPLHTYSRILGEDLSLYLGGSLVNTNQPEMYRMGYMNRRLPFALAHALVVAKTPFVLEHASAISGRPAVAYAPVKLAPGREGVLAMTIIPFSQRQQQRWLEQIEFSLTLLSGLLVLMALLTRYLAKSFLQPISAITHAAARMAKGLANKPIVIHRQDELNRMVTAFNMMQEQVQASQTQLRQQLRLLDETMNSMSSGLLGFDENGRLILENHKAWRLLQLPEPVDTLAELVALSINLRPLKILFDEGTNGEFDFQARRAGEERQIIGKVRMVRVAKAQDVRCIVAFEDITDALAANRFKAWAEMARRVAHEIKNPLTPIQLELDHLNRLYADQHPSFGEALAEASTEIRAQVEHLKRIATEFSDYARPLELQRATTDIGGLLREMLDPYEKTLPGVQIERSFKLGVVAQVDARLLRRALHNLIVNAVQAMDNEGSLSVSLDVVDGEVVVAVQDTGPGIPEEDRERVFEAYFSTKNHGSGLGLVIARKYLTSHGGDLYIDPDVTTGTRFVARFPLAPAE